MLCNLFFQDKIFFLFCCFDHPPLWSAPTFSFYISILALYALNFNHSWSGTTNILPNSMVVFVLEGAVWTFLLFHLTALLLGPFLLSISQAVELHKVCKTLFNNTLFCIFRCVEICFSNPNYNVITHFVCLQHWVIP